MIWIGIWLNLKKALINMTYSQNWGTGPQAALLLHCSLATSDAWRGVALRLQDDLTMTGFDFLGHGRSPDWEDAGDYHAACTQQAYEQLTQPMHLIGHSFGATVALRMAAERPDMVRSLTLIEPVYFAAAKATEIYAAHVLDAAPFVSAIEQADYENAANIFNESWGSGAAWAVMPAKLRAYIVARIGLVLAAAPALYDDNAQLMQAGQLEGVQCPVLLVEGAQSPEIIAAINAALLARLPDAKRVVIKGASHMVPISHADQVADAIAAFLASDQG